MTDIHTQIDNDVKNNDVVLFMKGTRDQPRCGFSARVVEMIDGYVDTYATFDVLADMNLREAVKEYAQWPTFPQLYVGGEFVGGCDIVTQLEAAGELAEGRDFASYGAQMDASLQQKLADLVPSIRPGCIVDKGCGTGKLVAALAERFPASAVVGVDLSAEMLRRCAALGVPGVVWQRGDAALPAVAPGSGQASL
jgi:monothiol glutaredoxin